MMGRGIAAMFVTMALATPSHALVLCTKAKSGVPKEGAPIKLRTACTAKEVAVDPDAAGLRGPAGPAGPIGANGTNGTHGTNGTNGAPGLSGLEIVTADGDTIISGLQLSANTATCPAGKSVIGGGVGAVLIAGSFSAGGVFESFPVTNTSPQGWHGSMLAQASDDWFARAYAVCATVSP